VLVFSGGLTRELPRMSKLEIARELVRVCEFIHLQRQQSLD
jgi:hypothetical protein